MDSKMAKLHAQRAQLQKQLLEARTAAILNDRLLELGRCVGVLRGCCEGAARVTEGAVGAILNDRPLEHTRPTLGAALGQRRSSKPLHLPAQYAVALWVPAKVHRAWHGILRHEQSRAEQTVAHNRMRPYTAIAV